MCNEESEILTEMHHSLWLSKCIAVSEMAVEVKNNKNAQLSQTADISKSLAAPRREHGAVVQAWPWLEFCVLLFCLSCHMTDEI